MTFIDSALEYKAVVFTVQKAHGNQFHGNLQIKKGNQDKNETISEL